MLHQNEVVIVEGDANDAVLRVEMSKIIASWYKFDFGESPRERLRTCAQWMSPPKREAVTNALHRGVRVDIKPREYDWALNGK